MANHKRARPKHQRAGCLLCKPHKDERVGGATVEPIPVRRALQPDGATDKCDCPHCLLGDYVNCYASFWDDADHCDGGPDCLECNPPEYATDTAPLRAPLGLIARAA